VSELQQAITLEDQLAYMEPPEWALPVRHALGAILLSAGRAQEAEAVYRADLVRWPDNGWSLHGLADSLEAQGDAAGAAEARAKFDKAWAQADVQIGSSCSLRGARLSAGASFADRPGLRWTRTRPRPRSRRGWPSGCASRACRLTSRRASTRATRCCRA
jgi:tetratricopeptide (TPR) repeat protein